MKKEKNKKRFRLKRGVDGYDGMNYGAIYGEDEKPAGATLTVAEMVTNYPDDWEEWRDIRYPAYLYVMMSLSACLYLYAGLAIVDWPLIPATTLSAIACYKAGYYSKLISLNS